jgi:ACS family hexuronate transporter-like MFS transporter
MFGTLMLPVLLRLESLAAADWAKSLGEIVRLRRFWVAAAVGITTNITWHFLVNWTAFFFQENRGFGMLWGGLVSALPFVAADLGNLGGGVLVRWLARLGLSTTAARKWVMTASLPLISCAVWVGMIRSQVTVVLFLCVAALGTAAFMVNYFAFGQDVAPQHTGLVIGCLGGLGNLFAAGFMPVAGWVSEGPYGFTPNFIFVGLLPIAGLAALLLFWQQDNQKQAGWTNT